MNKDQKAICELLKIKQCKMCKEKMDEDCIFCSFRCYNEYILKDIMHSVSYNKTVKHNKTVSRLFPACSTGWILENLNHPWLKYNKNK